MEPGAPQPPSPAYFWTKLRPEEPKKSFERWPSPPPPPTPLPKGLDDRPLSLGLNPALTGVLLLYRQCFLKGFCI